ncbi:hypothetical protein ACZ91_67255, partial [Streptomyces regensis]
DVAELGVGPDVERDFLVVHTRAPGFHRLCAEAASDFPFDARVSGEVVRVTAITGTGATQSFTVVRSVNGVVKAQLAGADIRLARPTTVAL